MGSNPVESPEFFRFMRQLLKLSSKCEDHVFIWMYCLYEMKVTDWLLCLAKNCERFKEWRKLSKEVEHKHEVGRKLSKCSHCGWLLLKCSAIGIGFNGAETNCRIAHILGILLMNSCNTDRFLATTVVCGLSTLNWIECCRHLCVCPPIDLKWEPIRMRA